MGKKIDKNRISGIAKDILKEGPSSDIIIDSILHEQSKSNDGIMLRVGTSDISYEVFKGKGNKLNIVKEVKPSCKTAGSDFNKSMTKKEVLKEVFSSIAENFLGSKKDFKEFIKELK